MTTRKVGLCIRRVIYGMNLAQVRTPCKLKVSAAIWLPYRANIRDEIAESLSNSQVSPS